MTRRAAVAAVCLALFVWLLIEVNGGRTLPWDLLVRNRIHQLASRPLTTGFVIATQFGSWYWILPCSAALLVTFWKQGRSNQAILLATVLTGSYVLEYALKIGVGRIRPEPFFGFPAPSTFSFPSGHAFFSTAFYGTLAHTFAEDAHSLPRRTAIWLSTALTVALICVSRVYLGVHYPTDVMGGVLVACFWINSVLAFKKSPSS